MTTTVAKKGSTPSALAIAVVFGGGLGLTLGHKLGLSGNVGFLVGTTSIFLLLAFLIINDRRREKEFTVEELEKNIRSLRSSIYENFVSTISAAKDGVETDDRLTRTVESIREAVLSDSIRRFATGKLELSEDIENINRFSKDAGVIIDRLKSIQDRLDVDIPLRGLEILKRQADEEILAINKKGRRNESN